jgi:hypothetical protein
VLIALPDGKTTILAESSDLVFRQRPALPTTSESVTSKMAKGHVALNKLIRAPPVCVKVVAIRVMPPKDTE